ncbi:MAG: DMT family transporter [Hyphomicrobiaceae bacterium]
MTAPRTAETDQLRGVALMIATMAVFSVQDGLTRYLAEHYQPIFIVMVRYWAFALFVLSLSAARPGGIRGAARTVRPMVQMFRGLMLAFQICIVTYSFWRLGLAETHAIMAVNPMLVAILGAVFLGERVTIAQWAVIALGFAGVLVLLAPSAGVIDPFAAVPLLCALMFAAYQILTRWVGRSDKPATSFFYTGIGGAIGMTAIGPFFAEPMAMEHWAFMAALCVTGATGHFLLIKAYEAAEAASLQPFAYLQLAATSAIGVFVFGETLTLKFFGGTALIVVAGLLALQFNQRRRATPSPRAPASDEEEQSIR